ncbi:MAG TPA: hypothetical protein VMT23_00380 [Candidatus Binatia bacterium]|nr:hypothetical protein [Candidatus Binatia bacterium]
MSLEFPVFRSSFDLESAVEITREQGYFFQAASMSPQAQEALAAEIDSLPLEVGDHVAKPINAGKANQVKQQHARAYYEYGEPLTPAANFIIESLAETVQRMRQFPELQDWQLTEIGYQRYRPSVDFIGAHRDRASDKLLSVTFTIVGSTTVKIFEHTGDYWDYSKIRQTDEFETDAGTTMMLRAPGFGGGEQVIHQVLPPEHGVRDILNLRMRPSVLEQPNHPKWDKK